MNGQVRFWKCPNCGQVHFGDEPPDMCDFCKDFTTWRLISGSEPRQMSAPPAEQRKEDAQNDDTGTQLPLFPGE